MSNAMSARRKKEIRHEACCASFTDGWVNTNLEKDKSILAISSGAIALLVTLLASLKVSSLYVLVCYIASLVFFFITIILVINVFSKNADFFAVLLKDEENTPEGKKLSESLKFMDRVIKYLFLSGILTTIFIAAHHGFTKLYEEEVTVTDKKTTTIRPTKDSSTASVGKGGILKPGPKGPK